MALTFKAPEQHLATHIFQSSKELFGLLDIATQVAFAVDDQYRSVYVLDICDGRHTHIALWVIPGRHFHVIISKIPANVTAAKERKALDHTAISYRCPEALSMPDQPACHETTVTATNHAQALFVDIALL